MRLHVQIRLYRIYHVFNFRFLYRLTNQLFHATVRLCSAGAFPVWNFYRVDNGVSNASGCSQHVFCASFRHIRVGCGVPPVVGGTGNDEWPSVRPDGRAVEPVFDADRGPDGAGPASLSHLVGEGVATIWDGELSLFVARNVPGIRGYVDLSVE